MTSLFCFVDIKYSGYLDLVPSIDSGAGFTVNQKAGRQRVKNSGSAAYSDWKLGVTKDLGLASVQLAAAGTHAGTAAYASPVNGKFLGKNALQLTVSRTF